MGGRILDPLSRVREREGPTKWEGEGRGPKARATRSTPHPNQFGRFLVRPGDGPAAELPHAGEWVMSERA